MIISAADYNFRECAVAFISSLLKNGKIGIDNFIFFIFDISPEKEIYQTRCLNMAKCISNINSEINYEIINFDTMQDIIKKTKKYDFLSIIDVADHLKALIYNYIKMPYLWIDSDIIVRKEINSLYNECKERDAFALVVDRCPVIEYYQYYRQYADTELHRYFKHLGTFNAGVMYIPKNYIQLWQDIFRKVGNMRNPCLGQGVWNVIFWLENQACILDKKYNTFYKYDSYFKKKNAYLLHFAAELKKDMVSIYGKTSCPKFSSSS